MPQTVTIQDQFPVGQITHTLDFVVQNERLAVHELIEQRVLQEVALHGSKPLQRFNPLIQPVPREKSLNDKKKSTVRQVNAEKQIALALQAFGQNSFFILVNDNQVERLDDVILMTDSTKISFIKLVPLVGG